MARRKNTADCKDVLGKIFEAKGAGEQRGRRSVALHAPCSASRRGIILKH